MSTRLLSLRDCLPGATVTICSISPLLSVAQRLRELGVVEGSHVLLLKQEDPVLLLVKDSRIAIDPATAGQIVVSHFPDSGPAPSGDLNISNGMRAGLISPIGAVASETKR